MKIRTGFVSNSSSSSFLIIYKDLKDFEKLDRFKGYVEFIKDLKAGTSSFEAIRGIEQLILNFSYDALEAQLQFKPYKVSADIHRLFTAAKEPLESLNDIMAKYVKPITAYYKKIFDKYPELEKSLRDTKGGYLALVSKEQSEYILLCRKEVSDFVWTTEFQGDLDARIEKLAERLCNKIEESGRLVGKVEYFDYTDEGEFMKSDFMPFVMVNPEREYSVLTIYSH